MDPNPEDGDPPKTGAPPNPDGLGVCPKAPNPDCATDWPPLKGPLDGDWSANVEDWPKAGGCPKPKPVGGLPNAGEDAPPKMEAGADEVGVLNKLFGEPKKLLGVPAVNGFCWEEVTAGDCPNAPTFKPPNPKVDGCSVPKPDALDGTLFAGEAKLKDEAWEVPNVLWAPPKALVVVAVLPKVGEPKTEPPPPNAGFPLNAEEATEVLVAPKALLVVGLPNAGAGAAIPKFGAFIEAFGVPKTDCG